MQELLHDYLKHLKNENYAKTTIDNRKSLLSQFVEKVDKNIEDITFSDISDYLTYRRKLVKSTTLNLEKGTLRSFFGYCQQLRGVKMTFSYSVIKRRRDPKGNIRFLSPTEVSLAIKNMKNPQDRLITAVLFETGMRIGEVVNLRVSDIYLTEINVRGKGGDRELVFVTDKLATEIGHHLKANQITSGPIFRPLQKHKNNTSGTYAVDSVRKRLEREFEKVGIKMHPHMLRHGFGTHLLRNKTDMRTIQTLMRHKSIETTMIYTHVTDPHMQEAHRSCFKQSVLVV